MKSFQYANLIARAEAVFKKIISERTRRREVLALRRSTKDWTRALAEGLAPRSLAVRDLRRDRTTRKKERSAFLAKRAAKVPGTLAAQQASNLVTGIPSQQS